MVSKIPQVPQVVIAKLLGRNKLEVVREEELPNIIKSKDKLAEEKVNVSL